MYYTLSLKLILHSFCLGGLQITVVLNIKYVCPTKYTAYLNTCHFIIAALLHSDYSLII